MREIKDEIKTLQSQLKESYEQILENYRTDSEEGDICAMCGCWLWATLTADSKHDKDFNYQGINDVELTIEIKEPENQIEYLVFDFILDEADIKTTFSTGAESYSKRVRHGLNSNCGTSYFSDNVYTTIFDKNECNSMEGHMTVTFLDDPRRVNVHAEWSVDLVGCIGNYIVDYEGIPFNGPNGTASDLYYESGSSVSRINISRYEMICTNMTKELLNTNCENDAEIGVWVYYSE